MPSRGKHFSWRSDRGAIFVFPVELASPYGLQENAGSTPTMHAPLYAHNIILYVNFHLINNYLLKFQIFNAILYAVLYIEIPGIIDICC